MKPPIFADVSGDLCVFKSVESAESYLEVYDIHETTVYDSTGAVLEERAVEWRVKIVAPESPEFRPDELAAAIRRYLEYLRSRGQWNRDAKWLESATLDCLVQEMVPFAE